MCGPKFCSKKIAQELRDFAVKHEAPVETFVTAEEAVAGMPGMGEQFRQESCEVYSPTV